MPCQLSRYKVCRERLWSLESSTLKVTEAQAVGRPDGYATPSDIRAPVHEDTDYITPKDASTCVSISESATDSWCADACSEGMCSTQMCKCDEDATKGSGHAADTATELAAEAPGHQRPWGERLEEKHAKAKQLLQQRRVALAASRGGEPSDSEAAALEPHGTGSAARRACDVCMQRSVRLRVQERRGPSAVAGLPRGPRAHMAPLPVVVHPPTFFPSCSRLRCARRSATRPTTSAVHRGSTCSTPTP